jgi:hypothetical protein
MRNKVDPNRCREDAEEVPLAPGLKGEEARMSDSNPNDTQREPVVLPVARCPMRAILDKVLEAGIRLLPYPPDQA